MTNENAYVSTREASQMLGISLRTAQLWVESGVLLAWKTTGGHRRILRNSVDALLEERKRIDTQHLQSNPAATLKIVVVEDDPDQSRLIKMTLSDLNAAIEIRSAVDGFAGLVLIGQFKPHLVIADLNMPGMDGFRMINSLIGSEFAPQKIIVSTALSPSDIESRCGLPDIIEVLQKPYLIESLEAKVLPLITKSL
jgi:excisionase family DNA binding protein